MQLRKSPSGPTVTLPSFAESETQQQIGASGVVDFSDCPAKNVTLTAPTCSITFDGQTPGEITWCQLALTQDATGARTVTFPGTLTPGGIALTLSSAPGATDLVSLFFDGSVWWAQIAGLAFS